MRMFPSIYVAGEGMVDAAVVERLFKDFHLPLGPIYQAGGKENLRKKISGYNHAAQFFPWFVLVDLNQEAPVLLCSGAIGYLRKVL